MTNFKVIEEIGVIRVNPSALGKINWERGWLRVYDKEELKK